MDDTNRAWWPSVAPCLDTVTMFERCTLPLLDSLYSAARQLMRNAADVDDLVEDTYVQAFRGFDQLADDANPREWLFGIFNNLYVDRCRTRERASAHAAVPKLRDATSVRANTRSSCSQVHTAIEARHRPRDNLVKEAVRTLPGHLRMAVYLADVEGFSYRDIAGITGTTVATVTSRLNRARTRLRELLSNRRT